MNWTLSTLTPNLPAGPYNEDWGGGVFQGVSRGSEMKPFMVELVLLWQMAREWWPEYSWRVRSLGQEKGEHRLDLQLILKFQA